MSVRDLVDARRTVADELAALARLTAEAGWPPWADPRFDDAIASLRRMIDARVDHNEEQVRDVIAAQHGLDLETLESLADVEHVTHWVTVLLGSETIDASSARILALLLDVYLCPDELAYLGVLAIAALDEVEGVFADGG